MSLTVAALVPALAVVAAYLQAVSKSAGKLTRAVKKEEPPARLGAFYFDCFLETRTSFGDKPRLREPRDPGRHGRK